MEEKIELENRVDAFVDKYWPALPSRTEEAHEAYLRNKYGRQTMRKCDRLFMRHEEKNDSVFMNFLYKEGLTEDLIPYMAGRGRETLKALLQTLSTEEKPFTMVDLGSGDGRITVGLAGYLDNLKTIYAVEKSKEGIERMQKHYALAPDAGKKIVPIIGDFFSPEVQKRVSEGKPTIALAAYTNINFHDIAALASMYADRAILSFMHGCEDFQGDFEHHLKEHEADFNYAGAEHGWQFKITKDFELRPGLYAYLVSGAKRE